MIENNNLSPSELLHQFLDGELDVAHEKQLFTELASNEELRTEMREMLAVRESVQNDLEAFTPPPESAGVIFGRVGLKHPVSSGSAGSAILRRNVLGGFMRRAWVPVAAAVVASLLTAWFLTNKYEKRFAELENKIPVVKSIESNSRSSAVSGDLAQKGSEGAVRERKIYVYQKPVVIYRDIPESATQNNNQVEESNTNNDIASLDIADAQGLGLNSSHASIGSQPENRLRSAKGLGYTPIDLSTRKNSKYSVLMRGISAASFPTAPVPLQGNALFSNMSFGAYMDYTRSVKVGFEFGREPFGQEFVNVGNTVGLIYEQNPLMYWGALGVRYEMDEPPSLLMGGRPFAGLLIGGTEQGPLGKFISGLQFVSPDMGIGILFGIEGSMLWYQHQGRTYNTKKIGFTYGMSFHF